MSWQNAKSPYNYIFLLVFNFIGKHRAYQKMLVPSGSQRGSRFFLSIVFLTFLYLESTAFKPSSTHVPSLRPDIRSNGMNLNMKWSFGKGSGPLADMGGIGSHGEYYYIPSKRPSLKAPPAALGKERILPIFPRNQVLVPLAEEYIGVYEMRYRHLLHDIGEQGTFGHLYYSQENSKLALVGTLSRIKKTERLDDGGMYVLMEGVGRFFIKEVIAEKPYLKAKVQIFEDYTENEQLLESLERSVVDEVRYSVKVMKLLYPQNNYTMNESVLRYRPPVQLPGIRIVKLLDDKAELDRRSKFSLAVISMLKTDPVTKLVFLQEPVLERRYSKILKVLQESTSFLEGELRKRGLIDKDGQAKLRTEALLDISDLENVPNASSWNPNLNNGEWRLNNNMMD